MRSRSTVLGSVALLALVVVPSALRAQASLTADAGVASAYVWRGVSLTNRAVLQPDAILSVPAAGGGIVVAGWANVEAGHYDHPGNHISQGGGQSSLDVTEIDLWAEYSHALGPKASGTLGFLGYLFPNGTDGVSPGLFTNRVNRTAEIYGKLQLSGVPLAPRIGLWYDVAKVNGAYIEGAVSQAVPVGSVSLTLGALAGFSAGQGINADDATEIANFAGNGLTHVDLSAAAGFPAGPVTITPNVHFYVLDDDFTRVTGPGELNDVKLTAGVTLTWSKVLSSRTTE